jgi:hypothetical protein
MDQPDEPGPVDYVVVEYPAGTFDPLGEMTREVASLADVGMIRLLDVVVLDKDHDGGVALREPRDLPDCPRLRELAVGTGAATSRRVLARTDLDRLGRAIDNGTSAGVLVWEQTWVRPLATAARTAGGRVLGSGRIPQAAIMTALAVTDTPDDRTSPEDPHP